jgi:phage/plasmid-associated DNA primase
LWEKFLGRIMDGNLDLIAYLQRVVGHALTGDVSEPLTARDAFPGLANFL